MAALSWDGWVSVGTGLNNTLWDVVIGTVRAPILLPLRPASVMHKNPQRHKIIHGMRPVGCKERWIDLKIPFW